MHPDQGGDGHQGQAGQQPMGRHLGQHHQGQGLGRHQHLLQGAVLVIGGEEALQGQHGGQQGRDPDHAGPQDAQDLLLRAHAQREEADNDDEKEEGGQDIGPPAHGQAQVATEDAQKDAPHQADSSVSPTRSPGWSELASWGAPKWSRRIWPEVRGTSW